MGQTGVLCVSYATYSPAIMLRRRIRQSFFTTLKSGVKITQELLALGYVLFPKTHEARIQDY